MQFGAVLAPIAAATIVNAILAWFAWRGTVVERRTRKAPWQLEAGIAVYGGVVAAISYLLRAESISTPISLFAAAFVGEALGLLIAYGLGRAYQMRGEPWGRRGLTVVMAVGLTLAVFAGIFAT